MGALEPIREINRKVNIGHQYRPDERDDWLTPTEFARAGAGDCEDFAIAKMARALQLGLPNDGVRLVYCRRQIGRLRQAHMVLEVRLDGEAWVLDNLGLAINRWADRPDLQPVFRFNARRLWLRDRLTRHDPQARIGKWRDVIARAARQGDDLGADKR